MLLLLLGCWAPTLAPPGPQVLAQPLFVRGGLLLPEAVPGSRPLPDGRAYLPRGWQPGERLELELDGAWVRATAPEQPACELVFRVGLGDRPPASLRVDDDALLIERAERPPLCLDAWLGLERPEGCAAPAPASPTTLPPGCPAERPTQAWALPSDRLLALEGPFTEPSGETAWRLALFL